MESRKAAIRQFLASYLRNYDLQDDEDIFSLGFVNSMLAIQLVNFVEKNFGIEVENEDLDLDNFRSLAAMDAFVERKSKGNADKRGQPSPA